MEFACHMKMIFEIDENYMKITVTYLD